MTKYKNSKSNWGVKKNMLTIINLKQEGNGTTTGKHVAIVIFFSLTFHSLIPYNPDMIIIAAIIKKGPVLYV